MTPFLIGPRIALAAVAAFARERPAIPMEQMAQPQITGYCRAPPWMGNNLVTKTVTIVLPMLQSNQFRANQPAGQVWLDFYIQDDTEVDFAQLTLVQ